MRFNQNIIIAKIDGSENEIPGFEIEDYSNVKFITDGGKNILEYNEEASVEGFINFL